MSWSQLSGPSGVWPSTPAHRLDAVGAGPLGRRPLCLLLPRHSWKEVGPASAHTCPPRTHLHTRGAQPGAGQQATWLSSGPTATSTLGRPRRAEAPGCPTPPGPGPHGDGLPLLPVFSLNQGPRLRPGSGENWFGGSRQGAVKTLVLDASWRRPQTPRGRCWRERRGAAGPQKELEAWLGEASKE